MELIRALDDANTALALGDPEPALSILDALDPRLGAGATSASYLRGGRTLGRRSTSLGGGRRQLRAGHCALRPKTAELLTDVRPGPCCASADRRGPPPPPTRSDAAIDRLEAGARVLAPDVPAARSDLGRAADLSAGRVAEAAAGHSTTALADPPGNPYLVAAAAPTSLKARGH
jgi:hypothetical protein